MRFTVILFSFFFYHSVGFSAQQKNFLSLFKEQKPIIAAIMVEKDLSTDKKYQEALKWSLEQLKIAEQQKMDGILFEFRGGKIMEPPMDPKRFSKMVSLSQELVKAAKTVVVGVEILWHFPKDTLLLAKKSGASFVRIDFFSDEVIADKKKVPLNPKEIIQYKNKIGAQDVYLLTDIQVKYSKMVDPKIPLSASAKKALSLGSDGVIVTSTKSGSAPGPERPQSAKQGAKSSPVVIGSGFSYKNAESLLKYADAAIVGTSISVKTGGPLLPKKVEKLMNVVRDYRKQQKSVKK